MHSWIFRHRHRLRAIFGLAPTDRELDEVEFEADFAFDEELEEDLDEAELAALAEPPPRAEPAPATEPAPRRSSGERGPARRAARTRRGGRLCPPAPGCVVRRASYVLIAPMPRPGA